MVGRRSQWRHSRTSGASASVVRVLSADWFSDSFRRPGQHLSPYDDLPRARNAAVLTRFWQGVEQNRRVPLRETSTYTRSQCGAVHTPSRSANSLPSTSASPVAQLAAQSPAIAPPGPWKCRCHGSPSCRWSIGLGRAAYPHLTFVTADLRTPGWTAALGLDRPADAAVSTTALHWISPPDLESMYAELATALRPGGLLLNGDHLDTDDTTPALARLERDVHDKQTERTFADGRPEDWRTWWDAVAADPAMAALNATRTTAGADHYGSESHLLSQHANALREAGFSEIGTLWQRDNNRLLCAVR